MGMLMGGDPHHGVFRWLLHPCGTGVLHRGGCGVPGDGEGPPWVPLMGTDPPPHPRCTQPPTPNHQQSLNPIIARS